MQDLSARIRNLAADTVDVWEAKLDILAVLDGGSAIEKLLYVAFKVLEENCDCYVMPPAVDYKQWAMDHVGSVVVMREVSVKETKYTADFWLLRLGTGEKPIIVECDGHEFHERTKEQAEHDRKRDRRLTALGHKVLRFTGREIWRDPMKCATEALELAFSQQMSPALHQDQQTGLWVARS
jgi:very-short-patch-repair endonuclease